MKPQKLYRGIHLNLEMFKHYDFRKDIEVHYDALVNSEGKKIVTDGNEYGVYLTSNKQMAYDVYGKAHHTDIPLVTDVIIGRDNTFISLPMIGIVYEIDTDGLEVRKPWISQELSGVYNNGYQGEEWIADNIPNNHYKVLAFQIGADILHEDETINVNNNILECQDRVVSIIEERKKRLLLLAKELKKNPNQLRFLRLHSLEMNVYRKIFSIGGFMDHPSFDKDTIDGFINSLEQLVFDNSSGGIEMYKFLYLESLANKMMKVEDIKTIIIDLILKDKQKDIDNYNTLLEKSKKEGRIIDSSRFMNKIIFYDELISYLNEYVYSNKSL